MGRIKTAFIKRITNTLVNEHRDEFKTVFGENKPIVGKFAEIPSKKLRNIIAGYVTRLVRAKKESDEL